MPALDITIIGNLGRDPELKSAAGGAPLCTFSIASSSRFKDDDGEWKDGPTSWVRCCAWDDLAEHIARDLHKGDRVIVQGTLRQRDYTTAGGEQRTSWEVTVADAGPSIKFHAAKVAPQT